MHHKRFKTHHGQHSAHADSNEPNTHATHVSSGEGLVHQERLLTKQENKTIYRVSSSVLNGSDQGVITLTTSYQYGAINFKASSVPDFSNYAACFDEYRLEGIKVKFIPTLNVAINSTDSATDSILTQAIPIIGTAIDVNDSATPSAVNTILGKDSAKSGMLSHIHKRKLVPFISKAVYQSGFTGYGPEMNSWCDTASSGVNWYGLKWFVGGTGQTVYSSAAVNVVITYYFAFRMSV